ncbi:MAG: hypothetical protein A3D47_01575 [Candidatus Colwellbacteria bacterium RIFCSPHIGHO2_02_FULL_43_15]|uniref:Uncharacterized protein n=2 Tax=Candidatus Colwelliibacteriota TaxID=1817904 RepID=A0A1G1Z0G4_9BACT|nr:MAG: hypothetical protein A3D47_01575 [Candidatus Colwellbacteria bacterium RIFCSPHIGHO2_02_FULL_43_15]OGY60993.1 MAG: hypothetical protein A3F99_01490 [Candidatus Colwellbacteria bacterium RIFCSPLOWO2_12_FULL_43_11]
MNGNNLKLIIGIIVATLLVVAGLYYYVAIYGSSPYNAAEIDIPNVETPPQPSSTGTSGGDGGGGSPP